MKLPCVVFDGAQTALALSRSPKGLRVLVLQDGRLHTADVPEGKWAVVPEYPTGLKIALYIDMQGAIMQAREVESLLAKLAKDRSLAFTLTKFDTRELERTMTEKATAAKAAKETKAVKGQAAAPAKAAGKPATKAAAPAKAKAADKPAGEARKGRPTSLDVNAKITKGEHKVSDFVREGSVREALMNAIVGSKTVGEALGKTLPSGHTVKSVDVNFAIEQGYIALK